MESNEEYLKNLVNKNRLNDHVIFTGFQKNIPLYLKCLDVFCLTSIEPEPYSSVVVEAMMARVPVIGTNIGGTPEIIKNEETGLLIEPNSPEELANAILKLYKDKNLIKKITENAYNHVLFNNTTEIKIKYLEKEYINIVEDGNK